MFRLLHRSQPACRCTKSSHAARTAKPSCWRREMGLNKIERAILNALKDRAMDVYDLSDAVNYRVDIVTTACQTMRKTMLVDWMYGEDPVSITIAGEAA